MPEIRKIQLAHLFRIIINQEWTFKIKQFRIFLLRLFPPGIKMFLGNYFRANTLIVKFKKRTVVHQNIAAATFVFQLLHFSNESLIFFEEFMFSIPIPFYQGRLNKDLAAYRWINSTVIHWSRCYNRHTVKRDFFICNHGATRFRPTRFGIGFFN